MRLRDGWRSLRSALASIRRMHPLISQKRQRNSRMSLIERSELEDGDQALQQDQKDDAPIG